MASCCSSDDKLRQCPQINTRVIHQRVMMVIAWIAKNLTSEKSSHCLMGRRVILPSWWNTVPVMPNFSTMVCNCGDESLIFVRAACKADFAVETPPTARSTNGVKSALVAAAA